MIDIPQIINGLQKRYCTTNPYELADKLDIIISRCDLGTIRGYYYKAYRVKQIFLNINLERNQEKFVLSHELGHAVLHPDCNTMFLKANGRLSVDKMEIQANKFAMQLLISDEQLQEYKGYSISFISRILGYSEELIELRLKN